MVQRRPARYICNRYHNTSSVSVMLNIINLSSLAERRLRTRLVYDVHSIIRSCCCTIRHINSFRYKDLEISPLTYRQMHTSKDIQTFILPIHNTTVEPTPYKYIYSRPYTFSRQLQRTANTCYSLQPTIVFFNIL